MPRRSRILPPQGGSPCASSLAASGTGRLLACFLLSSCLCWASSAEPSPGPPSPGPPIASPGTAPPRLSASELERLAEISRRLSELNERLRTELESSRLSSAALAASLESSTAELGALRRELESLRLSSSELAARAESSERESSELREALRRADASLLSLETSFEDYRKAAEARIRRAEGGRLILVLAAAAGWALALLGLAWR